MAILAGQASFDPTRDVLRGKTSAYALMPPEVVCGADVNFATWSRDGRFILIAVSRPYDPVAETLANLKEGRLPWSFATGAAELLLHDLAERRTSTVWRGERGAIQSVAWLGRSQRGVATVVTPGSTPDSNAVASLLMVDAGSGAARVVRALGEITDRKSYTVQASPVLSLAILIEFDGTRGRNSQLSPYILQLGEAKDIPIVYPPGYEHSHQLWAIDGNPRLIARRDNDPDRTSFELMPDGSTRLTTAILRGYDVEQNFAIDARDGEGAATTDGAVRKLRSWWIQAIGIPGQAALLSGDATRAYLSPNEEAAFYISGGAGFVRRIVKMPLAAYDAAMAAAAKQKAMQTAKVMGLAILIYAFDNDHRLPGSREFFDGVRPYVRDVTDMNGFVYLRDGGFTTDMKNPESVVLGYIQSGNGFAVVYADAHVVWSDKPPG